MPEALVFLALQLAVIIILIALLVRAVRAFEGMAKAQHDATMAIRELAINFRKSKEENR